MTLLLGSLFSVGGVYRTICGHQHLCHSDLKDGCLSYSVRALVATFKLKLVEFVHGCTTDARGPRRSYSHSVAFVLAVKSLRGFFYRKVSQSAWLGMFLDPNQSYLYVSGVHYQWAVVGGFISYGVCSSL